MKTNASIIEVKQALTEFIETGHSSLAATSVPSRYPGTNGKIRTVSEASIRAYRRRGIYLLNEFLSAAGGEASSPLSAWPETMPDPEAWVEWLLRTRLSGLAPKTDRLYRRSSVQILLEWPEDAKNIQRSLARLEGRQGGDMPVKSLPVRQPPPDTVKRTSAKRAKKFHLADLCLVLTAAVRSGQSGDRAPHNGEPFEHRLVGDDTYSTLFDWLVAGLASGLRPGEWRQCRLAVDGEAAAVGGNHLSPLASSFWTTFGQITGSAASSMWETLGRLSKEDGFFPHLPGSMWLVVYNAKHTNGRGNEETRSLDISGLSPVVKLAISRMVIRGMVYREGGCWESTQAATAKLLQRITRRLFPTRKTRISLYSCRHQALANFKVDAGLFDTAVLAGHAKESSPSDFYSSPKNAWVHTLDNFLEAIETQTPEQIAHLLARAGAPSRGRPKKRRRRRGSGGGGITPSVEKHMQQALSVVSGMTKSAAPIPLEGEKATLMAKEAARAAARSTKSKKLAPYGPAGRSGMSAV